MAQFININDEVVNIQYITNIAINTVYDPMDGKASISYDVDIKTLNSESNRKYHFNHKEAAKDFYDKIVMHLDIVGSVYTE